MSWTRDSKFHTRRRHWLPAVLGLVLVLAAGCGGSGSTASSPPATSPAKVPASTAPATPAAPAAAPAQKAAPAPAPAAKTPAGPQTAEEVLAALNLLPPAEREQRLVEGARKEGKVVVYGTTAVTEVESHHKNLQKKYPFLQVEYLRAATGELLQRTLTEATAGRLGADVLAFPAPEMYVLFREGLVGKYLSPERAAWNKAFLDKDGYWQARGMNVEVIAWNTKLVTKEQAPKSFEELTDPKWKGKLGRTTEGGRWVGGMLEFYGQDKGTDLIRRIADQKVLLNGTNTGIVTALTKGEVPVVFDVHNVNVEREKKKGAPVDYALPRPLFGHMNMDGITKKTTRPYAAALYIDFGMSKAGQESWAEGERTGGRADVTYAHPYILTAPDLVPYAPQPAETYEKYEKMFQQMFVRGQ